MSRSKSECPDLPEVFFVVCLNVHNNILTVAERTAMLLAELTLFSANNYWWTAEKDKLKAPQRRQTMDLAPETGKRIGGDRFLCRHSPVECHPEQ